MVRLRDALEIREEALSCRIAKHDHASLPSRHLELIGCLRGIVELGSIHRLHGCFRDCIKYYEHRCKRGIAIAVQHTGMNTSSHVLTSSCCLHFSEGHWNAFNVL